MEWFGGLLHIIKSSGQGVNHMIGGKDFIKWRKKFVSVTDTLQNEKRPAKASRFS